MRGLSLRRSDTRAAAMAAGFVALAILLQVFLLYGYLRLETLQEADRWAEQTTRLIRSRIADGAPADLAVEELQQSSPEVLVAARSLDAAGRTTQEWGLWPTEGRRIYTTEGADLRGVTDFLLLRGENHLVTTIEVSPDLRIEFAFPLSHFAGEARELGRGLVSIALFSGLVALGVAAFATRRAFDPLRRTTRLLKSVDAAHLGLRLPTRGTGDPVDRHAETLNAVLGRIDDAFARLREFSSDAAHELRTPLNRIRNVAEVALLDPKDDELREALEGVRRTSEDLSHVVESLLLLAEIADRPIAVKASRIEIGPWVRRAVEDYGPLFEERGVNLVYSGDGGAVRGEQRLLDRVLVNLLENALRHAASGKTVEIRTVDSSPLARIIVDDSGPGIAPADRERIFERFTRIDPARSHKGSGLGLALSRAIARLHGGDIHVGQSPIGGSRFVWSIPSA